MDDHDQFNDHGLFDNYLEDEWGTRPLSAPAAEAEDHVADALIPAKMGKRFVIDRPTRAAPFATPICVSMQPRPIQAW